MHTSWPLRAASLLAAISVLGACDSFEVEPVQVALFRVPTERLEDNSFMTTPFAFFIEGTGIRLSSTQVGQEGCIDQELVSSGNQTFTYIDAGTSITAQFADRPEATLTKNTSDDRTLYEVSDGIGLPFTPGEVIVFDVPGAEGGFPRRQVAARTAEAFTASDITLPASTTADLNVTWTPSADIPGSAMFYSMRYSTTGGNQDREVACVFRDDGTGVIGAPFLARFRTSSNRTATAQRGRITVSQTGSAITHVTSTYEVTVKLTDDI
jgi:hypothetical protein